MEEEDKKTVETGVAVEDSGMGLVWALKALTCITEPTFVFTKILMGRI